MSERLHHHNPAAHSRSRPTREKGRSLSNSSATSNCEPHDFIRLRASAAVGPESQEADGCPSFLEKRDRRERGFFIEKAHSARRFSPQGRCVHAPCPNKRRKDCVCHWVSNNEDADPYTILNALLVLAMIERKLYSYQNARFKQNSQWRRRREWCPPGVPYIAVASVVTSWAVAGQQVVFLYRMRQARVTLTMFPIATPRGRSSKFPWKGTWFAQWNIK